jgi:hypothetical protein
MQQCQNPEMWCELCPDKEYCFLNPNKKRIKENEEQEV